MDSSMIGHWQWKVNKTFVEIEEPNHEYATDQGKRSHSDDEGMRSTDSGSIESRIEDLHKWHRSWLSSDSGSWQADSEGNLSGTGRSTPSVAFNLEDALNILSELEEIVDSKTDVRDAMDKLYPDSDVTQFIPTGVHGEMLSLGSARHLKDPIGSFCRPCGFNKRGKCHKAELCLYCHFSHVKQPSKRDDLKTSDGKPSAAKLRRDRRKRDRDKMLAMQQLRENGHQADSGSSDADSTNAKGSRVVAQTKILENKRAQAKRQQHRQKVLLEQAVDAKSCRRTSGILPKSYEEEVRQQLASKGLDLALESKKGLIISL